MANGSLTDHLHWPYGTRDFDVKLFRKCPVSKPFCPHQQIVISLLLETSSGRFRRVPVSETFPVHEMATSTRARAT
ncbi:hypothetical protein YC2023_015690 [Brassica napus]